MTPVVRVLQTIVRERLEAARNGERATVPSETSYNDPGRSLQPSTGHLTRPAAGTTSWGL